MRVLAYDPYVDAVTTRARHAEKTDLGDLLRRADFVSVHCPRTAETMSMLGAEQLALMGPTAYFITTARGGVHDEQELARALRERRIASAGVDVFLSEPPAADHPLLQLDTVVATPHIAGVTAEAVRMKATEAAQQWIALFRGRVPPRLVNPEAWHAYTRRFTESLASRPTHCEADAGAVRCTEAHRSSSYLWRSARARRR